MGQQPIIFDKHPSTVHPQLIAIPADNATNNDTLLHAMAAVEGMGAEFDEIHSRVRCFAHVLHRAVKAGMEVLRLPEVNEEAMATATSADRSPVKKVSRIFGWSMSRV